MSIDASRIYNSYRKYMSTIDNPSPIKKKLLIEGKIIQKKISNELFQTRPVQSIKNTIISGTSILIQPKSISIQPKRISRLDHQNPSDSIRLSVQSSCIKFSQHSPVKSQIVPMRRSTVRCKSAYSKLQQLKVQKQSANPDRIFSSVSLLFDRKNTVKKSQTTETVQYIAKLKIHGMSPFTSDERFF